MSLRTSTASPTGPRSTSSATPPPSSPARPSLSDTPYGYDVRKGAAAYAPIIGTIGGFVVPAVVLVFEITSSHHALAVPLGRATSLLVLGLISSLLGAFSFAAIGAEQKLTADLPAAALYAGAATSIGIVAILAAFEVLASIYLKDTRTLFAMITAGMAIAMSMLVALVLDDAWIAAPPNHWLGTRKKAYFWGRLSAGIAAAVLLLGASLYFTGTRIALTQTGIHWFVGTGIVLAVIGGVCGMVRTMRTADGTGLPIYEVEAALVLGCLVAYLLAMLLSLP